MPTYALSDAPEDFVPVLALRLLAVELPTVGIDLGSTVFSLVGFNQYLVI